MIEQADIVKFWSRVDIETEDGCWLWAGGRHPLGHGQFHQADGSSVYAHRFAWEVTNGPIPAGLLACHVCDRPPCVNPDHIFLGTQGDNMADAARKGRTARGARHGLSRPGAAASGNRHGTRTHPEAYPRGEAVKHARLTAKNVIAIRREAAAGVSTRELADRFGVHYVTVRDAQHGRTWRHITEGLPA